MSRMPMKQRIQTFLLLTAVLIVLTLLLTQQKGWAWSSIDQIGSAGSLATHQFLNAEAYGLLKKHPAFDRSGFPSLEDIQAQSGVNVFGQGSGPDGIGNSHYAWHYFNSDTGDGAGPETVDRYSGYLKKNLLEKKEVQDGEKISPPARNAAYLGHFIQDMTVPFHVIGVPDSEAVAGNPGDEKKAGPFGNLTDPSEWKKMVERYRINKANDEKIDWFDPTYYDGNDPLWIKDSSHVLYEGLVEINFKQDYSTNLMRWSAMRKKNPVSPFYEKGDLEGMARRMAKATKNRLGTKSSPGPLWFNNQLMLYKEKIARELGSSVISVPFDQWWMAVQATYSVWRASFSALVIEPADVRLVKAADKPNVFHVKVQLKNLDPVAYVRSLNLDCKGQGGLASSGAKVSLGSLPATAVSKEMTLGTVEISPDRPGEGELLITVTGDFGKIPDSGEARFSIPVNGISMDNAIKMEDMRGSDKEWAVKFLSAAPYKLKVDLVPGGSPPSPHEALRVAAQNISPGAWIAPGDRVTLTAWEDELVSVPSVIGMKAEAAIEALTRAGFVPQQTERKTDARTAGQEVLGQVPDAGERVPPKSRVTIVVSVPQKPEPPAADNPEEETPPADPMTLLDETFSEQDKEPPVLSDLVITPKSAIITGNQPLRLTVQALDLGGNPLDPRAVASLSFNWIVNNPSNANIHGNGQSAEVSPIQDGSIQVICTAGGAMGIASIKIRSAEEVSDSAGLGSFIIQQQLGSIGVPSAGLIRVNPCCLPYCRGVIQ